MKAVLHIKVDGLQRNNSLLGKNLLRGSRVVWLKVIPCSTMTWSLFPTDNEHMDSVDAVALGLFFSKTHFRHAVTQHFNSICPPVGLLIKEPLPCNSTFSLTFTILYRPSSEATYSSQFYLAKNVVYFGVK